MTHGTCDSNLAWHIMKVGSLLISTFYIASLMTTDFQWQRFPETQQWLDHWIALAAETIPFLAELQLRMGRETGTHLRDWVDHLELGSERAPDDELTQLGFEQIPGAEESVWSHRGGLFPPIRRSTGNVVQLALKVDSVADFLLAHRINANIEGEPLTPLRRATVATDSKVVLSVLERHGFRGFEPVQVDAKTRLRSVAWHEAFRLRRREFDHDEQGFEEADRLVQAASEQIGVDWACDRFFAAEREYWQRRNHAAQTQWARQNRLGLGWANHDHHTYRSSREHFARLIALLERLGLQSRERFYGGAEAGWGAQVMEQPVAGIVVFADVDLSPTEVTGDFAHKGLEPRSSLGTVGLWCKLHGEAMLQAGMHHLECQFDFTAARDQLAQQGVDSMAPFTDFDYLKQSFTKGERWAVSEQRVAKALQQGWITEEQADHFRRDGSIGSHLEVLQRWDGYKGFNQTGISEIIRQTDPRRS